MKQTRAHSAKVQVQTHILFVLSPFTVITFNVIYYVNVGNDLEFYIFSSE